MVLFIRCRHVHGLYLKSEAGKEKVFSEVLMNFQYYMPVRIVSGEDCVKKNASLLRTLGKNVLVVTGKSSAKNGALEDAVFAFNMNGQKYTIYDRVPNNPTVACVEEGARIAREVGADCVVAIGGGSPMDAAKAIAMKHAVISVIGKPLKHLGTLTLSSFSLMPLIRKIARVKPIPQNKPLRIAMKRFVTKASVRFATATPKIAQLVVMSGR